MSRVYKWSINTFINPNPVYSHSYAWQYILTESVVKWTELQEIKSMVNTDINQMILEISTIERIGAEISSCHPHHWRDLHPWSQYSTKYLSMRNNQICQLTDCGIKIDRNNNWESLKINQPVCKLVSWKSYYQLSGPHSTRMNWRLNYCSLLHWRISLSSCLVESHWKQSQWISLTFQ
jgi:hypothetical protein